MPSDPNVTLRVKDQGGGPVIYARFRTAAGQRERALGRGWLVKTGDALAKPRGRTLGSWVDRRGRPQKGLLTVDAAWQRVGEVMEQNRAEESRAVARRTDDARVTLSEAVDRWVAARREEDPADEREPWKHSHAKNMRSYATRVARELGEDRFLDTFETEELVEWLASRLRPMRNGQVLDRPTSRKTRSTYAQVVKGLFAHAVAAGWVDEDPASAVPAYRTRRKRSDDPLRRHEYLTKGELRRALRKLAEPDGKEGGRHRSEIERQQDVAMVTVMAMLGLRPGEAIALVWEQIDFRAKVVRVVDSRTMGVTDVPKSGSGRSVPMAGEVSSALLALRRREVLTRPTDLVFVGRGANHVDKDALGRRFAAAQGQAGITPQRELRQMRNTFGTVCAAEGVPLRTIQQWMGHASIQTTEIYASFMPRDRDAAAIDAAFAA